MGREPRLLGDDAVGGHVPLPTRLQVKAAISRCAAIVTVMLIWVGALPIAVNPPAQAQVLGRSLKGDEQINFNIPSQPLADALYAYTAATGVEALAEGALLANLRSSEVRGKLKAEEALQLLLSRTGLTARFVDSGSFTLVPTPTPPAADAPSDIPRYATYSAMLQNAAKRALCRQADARPGYYRTAIQIWIAPSGSVERVVLVSTTGDVATDKALSDLFGALSLGAPPAGLPQPATLLILPRRPASDCASVSAAHERR
jgi:hypothetical protein